MPLIVDGVSGTLWGTWKRKALSVCSVVIALGGVISVIKANAESLEYVTPAPVYFVRLTAHDHAVLEAKKVNDALDARIKKYETAQAEVARTTYHIRRELADGKREQAEDNLFKAQRDLKAANHALEVESDPKTKVFIEGQVEDLSKQINKLEATKQKIQKAIENLDKTKGD